MASTSHVKAAANQQLGHLCSLRWPNSSKYTALWSAILATAWLLVRFGFVVLLFNRFPFFRISFLLFFIIFFVLVLVVDVVTMSINPALIHLLQFQI